MLVAFWNRVNSKYKEQNALVIFSHPRSGSTWLSDLFLKNRDRDYLTVYEPLGMYVPSIKKMKLFRWQYVPENESWESLYDYFDKILRGVFNPFIILKRDKKLLFKSNQIMIKFIKGNALLPWFVKHFKTRTPILLLRHPCAVVASQLNYKGKPEQFLHDYFRENFYTHRFSEYLRPYDDILQRLETMEEKLAATWCLSHITPLHHHKNNIDWITVYYEELLAHPKEEIQRVFQRVDTPLSSTLLNEISSPSFTSVNQRKKINVDEQLGKWKTQLTEKQVNSILDVLKKFNITCYNDHLMPIHS